MRSNVRRNVVLSAACAAAVAGLGFSDLRAATLSQNFDLGPGDFTKGTDGPSLISGSNANYWLNDNKTAGVSGPGEIGGVFVPSTGQVYLADTTIGGTG